MSTPILILGGGLAGLTAGIHLAERGIPVKIIEMESQLGGRLRGGESVTLTQNGQTWSFPSEHGIHGIWGQYHNLRGMLSRLEIDPGFVPAREEAWILRQPSGKINWTGSGSSLRKSWIPAPLHYLALFIRPRFLQMLTLRDLASMLRVWGNLIFATAYDPAVEATSPLASRTLADFFKGWSPTLQSLFVGLARNFTSAPPNEVPEAGFIAFLRFYTLLRRDSWAFSYLGRDSSTALIDPLKRKLESLGGVIETGAKAVRLDRIENGWNVLVELVDHNADPDVAERPSELTTTFTSDQLVLALDLPGAQALLLNSPSTAEFAQKLKWSMAVPTAVLRFWFSKSPTGANAKPEAGIFTGNFTLDNYFWLHRFQEPFSSWHEATGGSAIECHIYGPPEVLDEPDAVLLARGVQDLTRVWGNLRGSLVAQSVRRNPATHSLFSASNASEYLGVISDIIGIKACGDWIRYPHAALYMERATVTGIAAANAILEKRGLAPHPIRDVDPPEFLARGLERGLRWVRARARSYNRRRSTRSNRNK